MGTPPPARPLWDRLEAIRIENGWTRSQLAQRAGVARTTLEKWKTQPRAPLAPTIKSVAERLGIDYAEALDLAGITRTEPAAPAGPRDSDLDKIEAALAALREVAEDPEASQEFLARFAGTFGAKEPPDAEPNAADDDERRRDTA